jgi:hypothetical protein
MLPAFATETNGAKIGNEKITELPSVFIHQSKTCAKKAAP